MASTAEIVGVLRDGLRANGVELLRASLEPALRQGLPDAPRDVHLLLTVLDAGVPQRLRAGLGPLADEELRQETSQIVDQFGLSPDFARRTVEIWAMALGRLPETGVEAPVAPPPSAPIPPPPAHSEPPPAESVAPMASAPAAAPPGLSPVQPIVQPMPLGMPPPPPAPAPMASGPPPSVPPLSPVQPIPGGQPAGGVQPLPGVRPLPGIQPPPVAASAPPAQGQPMWLRVVIGVVGVVLIGIGILKVVGTSSDADPAPTTSPSPTAGPSGGGGRTAEGFPIVNPDTRVEVQGKHIDNDPNTLLYAFGLRFGQDTYTYQVAVDFTRGDQGQGLIKAFRNGAESTSGPVSVSRRLEGDAFYSFHVRGSLTGAAGAPPICVVTIMPQAGNRFRFSGTNGGTFGVYGAQADGSCGRELGGGSIVP